MFIPFTFPLLGFVLFNTVNEYGKHIFTGLHSISYVFFITTTEFLSKTGLILIALIFGFLSVEFTILAFVIGATLGSTMGLFFFFRFLASYHPTESSAHTPPQITDTFRYALPLFFVSIGSMLLTEVDTLMLGIFKSDSEVGIYGVAKQISIKLPQISSALVMGTLPVFAKLTVENKDRLRQRVYTLFKVNNAVFIPLISLGIFLAPWIIPFVFGDQYTASVLPLQILLLYSFTHANTVLLSGILTYVGKANKRARNLSLTIILNIALNLVLIPMFGAKGAAITTFLSYLPFSILNAWEVKKTFS
jgi:O-antigen/teichoic acid export membrane protein